MVIKTHQKEKIVLRALLHTLQFFSDFPELSVHVYTLLGLTLNFIGCVHLPPRSRSAGEELGRLIKEKDEQIAQLMEEGNVQCTLP